jgi:hypothetical protein
MLIELGLIVVVVVIVFGLAWRLVPSGWLTATTGTVGAIVIATHDSVLEMMPALKAAVPPEHQHWLTAVVLLLTVAARFRKRAET